MKEDNGFPNLAKKLNEEMHNEIDELKDYFEKSRIKGIELIKSNFLKGMK